MSICTFLGKYILYLFNLLCLVSILIQSWWLWEYWLGNVRLFTFFSYETRYYVTLVLMMYSTLIADLQRWHSVDCVHYQSQTIQMVEFHKYWTHHHTSNTFGHWYWIVNYLHNRSMWCAQRHWMAFDTGMLILQTVFLNILFSALK